MTEESLRPGDAPPVRTLRHHVGQAEVAVVTGGMPPAMEDVPGAGVAGLRVSPDAVAMLRWLSEDPDALPRGKALFIELGCGAGLLGLACAALRPEARLVLTDVAPMVPFAERSVAANEEAVAQRSAARPLLFGDTEALSAVLAEFGSEARKDKADEQSREEGEDPERSHEDGKDDSALPVVAVGAAIFYWECLYAPLAITLKQLCEGGGQALLGYFRRDWKMERRFWTKILSQHGLQADVLWEGEVEEPDDTGSFAPTCTRTTGEWNARVYRVSLLAGGGGASKGGYPAGEGAAKEVDENQPWLAFQGGDKKKGSEKKKGSKR